MINGFEQTNKNAPIVILGTAATKVSSDLGFYYMNKVHGRCKAYQILDVVFKNTDLSEKEKQYEQGDAQTRKEVIKDINRIMAEHYVSFCDLYEAAAFVEGRTDDSAITDKVENCKANLNGKIIIVNGLSESKQKIIRRFITKHNIKPKRILFSPGFTATKFNRKGIGFTEKAKIWKENYLLALQSIKSK